jgi:hypothetical protein
MQRFIQVFTFLASFAAMVSTVQPATAASRCPQHWPVATGSFPTPGAKLHCGTEPTGRNILFVPMRDQ